MPEKALKDYTNEYIREQLAGKTPEQKIEWLKALQAREEKEMQAHGNAIEWEREGLGLPHTVTNPLDSVAAIEKMMKKTAPAPKGSVMVFPKAGRKGGRKSRKSRKTRSTRSTRALTARRH